MRKYLIAKVWSDGTLSLCQPAAPMTSKEAEVFLNVNRRSDPDFNYVKLEVLEEKGE